MISHFVTGSPRWYFDSTNECRVVTRVVHKLQVSQKVFNLWPGVKKTTPMEKRKRLCTSIRSKNLWPPRILQGMPSFCNSLSMGRERALYRTSIQERLES